MASNQRVPSVVRQLVQLPRELIHQVIDDLPLFKILQIACFDIAYMDETILSHYHYQRLFPTAEDLAKTKAYFKLYLEISKCLQWPRDDPSSPLSLNVASSAHLQRRESVCYHLHNRIYAALREVEPHIELLNQYSATPIPLTWDSSHVSMLKERWETISAAEAAINGAKARQLNLLADFKARYPDMLRWTYDVVVDRLKLNTEHIVSRFRVDARIVLQTRFLTKSLHVKYAFRHDTLPLVPYDWCLRLFVAMLDRFPIEEEVPSVDFGGDDLVRISQSDSMPVELGGIKENLQATSNETLDHRPRPSTDEMLGSPPGRKEAPTNSLLDPFKSAAATRSDDERNPYPYPPAIAKDIATAISGLAYVNKVRHPSANSVSRSPRTKYNPYSAIPYNKRASGESIREPAFVTPPRVAGKARRKGTRLMPHHGREYEWLEAFLRSVEYMRSMLDENERKKLEKVEERERREMEGMMAETRVSKKEKRELKRLKREEWKARNMREREWERERERVRQEEEEAQPWSSGRQLMEVKFWPRHSTGSNNEW
jgi:hypothetical protein